MPYIAASQLLRFAVVAFSTAGAIFLVEHMVGMDNPPEKEMVFFTYDDIYDSDVVDLTDPPDEQDELAGYEGELEDDSGL